MSRCRSCQAEIIWAVTENGRAMPLDATPVPQPGLFTLETASPGSDAQPLAVSATTLPLYRSHFATCPDAAQHRRRS